MQLLKFQEAIWFKQNHHASERFRSKTLFQHSWLQSKYHLHLHSINYSQQVSSQTTLWEQPNAWTRLPAAVRESRTSGSGGNRASLILGIALGTCYSKAFIWIMVNRVKDNFANRLRWSINNWEPFHASYITNQDLNNHTLGCQAII